MLPFSLFIVAFKYEVALYFSLLINRSNACSIEKQNLICFLTKDNCYLSSGIYFSRPTDICRQSFFDRFGNLLFSANFMNIYESLLIDRHIYATF